MPEAAATRIGILRERPLHAALKGWYAQRGDRVEASVGGYVVDLVRGDLLIEIQTRGFSGVRRKLAGLLATGHRLRLVHPVAIDRWIVKVDDAGAVLSRRRSPRHGVPADVAGELVSVPDLLAHPNFELEVLLTAEEEERTHVAGRAWRRGGWVVVERRLLGIEERVILRQPADLAALLPAGLPDRFTTADLAAALRRPRRLGQQLAYCLRRLGLVVPVGKRRHAVEFALVDGALVGTR